MSINTHRKPEAMKKLAQLLVCILHPLAVLLVWLNLLGRDDIGLVSKLVWALVSIVPVVPFVYVLSSGELW